MSEKYTFSVDVDTINALRKLKDVATEAKNVGDANDNAAKKSKGAWETFQGALGAQAVIGAFKMIGSAATSAFGTILDATKKTETIKTELAVMTGSIESAEATYKSLQTFAAKTPFEIEGIANSARQLLAFGFDATVVNDKLQFIGDAASASGNSLQDLTQIFGQVSAAGKLTGERFNQLSERAIPIGSAIAKTMGVTESAVKDLVSEGKVSFKDFEKAFQSLSSEGGIFFDGMNKKSATLDGVLSTLSDTFDQSASDIGQSFLPAIKETVLAISDFIENNRELIKSTSQKIGASFIEFFTQAVSLGKTFVGFVRENEEALKFLGTALLVGATGWGIYAAAVTGAAAAQAAFAAVNPLLLALGAVVIAVTAAIRYWDELKIAFYGTIESIATLASSIPGLGDKMNALAASAREEAASIQAAKDAKIADSLAGEELANKKEELATTAIAARKREADAVDNISKEEKKAIAKHVEDVAKLKEDQRIAEIGLQIAEDSNAAVQNQARFAALEAQTDREFAIKSEARLQYLEGEKQTVERVREYEAAKEEIRKEALEIELSNLIKAQGRKEIEEEKYRKKVAEAEKERYEKNKKAREDDLLGFLDTEGNKLDYEKSSGKQRLDMARQGFATLAGVSKDGNKTLGEVGKGAAIAGATIDTYKAATGAYASLAGIPFVGPALGAAAAAAAIVAGMANVRAIGAQRFERGGIVQGSSYTGDNIGVRVNSGELILNRAQQKNLASQLGGNDNSDIVYVLNGLRADVQNLKLIVGDEDIFNANKRQIEAGRI